MRDNLRIAIQSSFIALTCLAVAEITFRPAMAATSRRFYFEKEKHVVWDVPVPQKVVAFTFDDGPGKYTPQILHMLKEYHDHATFFVIGESVRKYPDLLKQEIMDGHEIGNHTDNHEEIRRLGQHQMIEEIQKCSDTIEQVGGIHVHLFRSPSGYYDDRVVDTVNELGYQMILWSWDGDSRDWRSPGTTNIVKRILSGIHPGDIVIFHDSGGNRTQTVKALSILLPRLHDMGYQLVTVSQLFEMRRKTPEIEK